MREKGVSTTTAPGFSDTAVSWLPPNAECINKKEGMQGWLEG